MANPEHFALARQGRDVWNKWRRRQPDEPVDFSRIDFTAPDCGKISFAGFEFGPRADFSHCVFGGADHRGVAAKDISPYAPEIAPFLNGGAWFYGARFGDGANFAGSTFKGVALFQSAAFGRNADFRRAVFMDEANFVGARFGPGASFTLAAFAKLMQFERARFAGAVTFEGSVAVGVDGSSGEPNCVPPGAATLPHLVFRQARFGGNASFASRRLLDRADFAYAAFDVPPDFAGVTGRERLDFQGARFRLREGLVPGWTTRTATVAAIRTLRAAARDANAVSAERDLLVLEHQAERGVAWKSAHLATWAEPLRKVGLYGRALIATLLMFAYGLFSDCGRSIVRPILWLALINAGAYFAFRMLAKPASTAVGRAARGTWTWMKSIFVSPPTAPATSLSAEQQKSLFEFWWSSAVPGSVTRATYEKAAASLFG
ncbi:MAG: pentapeptide repeat-containing protein, partial [Alphaproteobacteria bacterium]